MKIKKKIIVGVLVALTTMGTMAMPVSATEITRTSSGKTFGSDWELYASGSSYSMVYGFNTACIDEDYCWTRSNKTSHTAIVKNSKGQYSKNAKKSKWAKIEVTHKGSLITYKMVY